MQKQATDETSLRSFLSASTLKLTELVLRAQVGNGDRDGGSTGG